MSLNYRTSVATMTDSLLTLGQEVLYKRCPSQRSLSQIRLPLLLVPRTTRASSPGSMFSFSTWSGTATRASTLKSASWRPPSLCTLNGRGVLCLGMCYRRFAILSRAPNGVSNEPCSHRFFLRAKLFVGHGGGGGDVGNNLNPSFWPFFTCWLFHNRFFCASCAWRIWHI